MAVATVSRPCAFLRAADPANRSWRVVEDVPGVDPFLLSEWVKEGAGHSGPLYRFDAGGQTAWGYRSETRDGFLVADTVDNVPMLYTGPMPEVTVRVTARLVGDTLNDYHWWLDDVCAQTSAEAAQ